MVQQRILWCVWIEREEGGVEGRGWGWFNESCLDVF
jgi:hypothetical protein